MLLFVKPYASHDMGDYILTFKKLNDVVYVDRKWK